MSSTVPLYVAIFDEEIGYKHWSLFIDDAIPEEKTLLCAMGCSTRYRFEMINSDARESETLVELFYLCHVSTPKISAIKDAAKNAVIHNESPGYNCQDYVLELLDDLEAKEIIRSNDVNYDRNKETLKRKQEGFA